MTAAATAAVDRVPTRFLRTVRHPAAGAVRDAVAFDDVYDAASSLAEVYREIVERLTAAAHEHGEVLYAVPGSPLVAERTVELLRADGRVEVDVVPGLSFLDLAWARLGVDPVAASVRVVDGQRFAVEAAGQRGPLLVAQCDSVAVLSGVKLAFDDDPPPTVVVLQRLGLPDESVREVDWADLDRPGAVEPDHLTSLWIPVVAAPVATELVRFAELVRELREKCPWDREQTHQSLTRHLLEETYETLEAIEGLPASYGHLEEELGDVLFQVVFHATLAAEEGQFTLADVARTIHDKLVGRHPHVFGTVEAETADAVMTNWEQIKKAEKGRDSIMEGIPGDLPSLLYAHKVQRKAASVGFDWPDVGGAYPKVAEELAELQADPSADELGDLLFAVVNVARHLKLDPEAALRGATAKFRDRFTAVESRAAERGIDMATADLATLDGLWDEVKRTVL
ncbi:MAG: putative MazG family protein [Acidimicrobiales bacterium]|jgi:tetrapyrrole methylase family protein/MazG family protein|nr:putative MazG family protein [Acidimicrobiales bacterium]